MSTLDLLLAHLALTWALVGLIWTIQLVQYPGFAIVGATEFGQFHDHHSNRIAWIVGPLMTGELLTGLALLWNGPTVLSAGVQWTGLDLMGLNWVWTLVAARAALVVA